MNCEERKQKTKEYMSNPQKGDRFSEMCSFWVIVLERRKNIVAVMEANPPCELPKGGTIYYTTVEEFSKKYQYDTIPGSYWVSYYGNKSVDGWLEERGGWNYKRQQRRKRHLVETDSLEKVDTFCGRNLSKNDKALPKTYEFYESDCLDCLGKKRQSVKSALNEIEAEANALQSEIDEIDERIMSVKED